MNRTNRKRVKYISLAVVFILMCVLRLWYTLLLVFAFGLVLTFITKRRNFCSDHCPMATLQDTFYRRHEPKKNKLYHLLRNPWVKGAVSILFWGIFALAVVLSYRDPSRLWTIMISLMLGSTASALILQAGTVKRAWCSTVCPYGTVLDRAVKSRRDGHVS